MQFTGIKICIFSVACMVKGMYVNVKLSMHRIKGGSRNYNKKGGFKKGGLVETPTPLHHCTLNLIACTYVIKSI